MEGEETRRFHTDVARYTDSITMVPCGTWQSRSGTVTATFWVGAGTLS
jgi:hypothetical protein